MVVYLTSFSKTTIPLCVENGFKVVLNIPLFGISDRINFHHVQHEVLVFFGPPGHCHRIQCNVLKRSQRKNSIFQ